LDSSDIPHVALAKLMVLAPTGRRNLVGVLLGSRGQRRCDFVAVATCGNAFRCRPRADLNVPRPRGPPPMPSMHWN